MTNACHKNKYRRLYIKQIHDIVYAEYANAELV